MLHRGEKTHEERRKKIKKLLAKSEIRVGDKEEDPVRAAGVVRGELSRKNRQREKS